MANSQGSNALLKGRIVWVNGDLFKGKKVTDMYTKQPKIDLKTGNQIVEYGFGLAVPKADCQSFLNIVQNEINQVYNNGTVAPPTFAYKFKDGDGVDDKGIPFSKREGYAGCYVFALTTRLPIKYFAYENGNNVLINEGIKCGDYVNVQVNIKAHTAVGQGRAGLYLNPNAAQLIGYGTAIVNVAQFDAGSVFGNVAPQTPQGATTQPSAPQAGFFAPQTVAPQQDMHTSILPQHLQPQAPQAFAAPQAPQAFVPNGFPNFTK